MWMNVSKEDLFNNVFIQCLGDIKKSEESFTKFRQQRINIVIPR